MTDTQEYPWIKHYPEGVPATINPDIYESLPDFQEKICQEYGDAPVFTSPVSYTHLTLPTSDLV